ncbi:AcrR family transcriptional regulator [Geodermatophilus bullaregiensis]|uniref:TetR/AcrR family transcriptional regulator n=1 Tax=Geodermatophilus bullaregiensis TaxID=1564160 RepID=UPI0027DD6C1C|nr:TetR/AcrR family transcriptional regulator [Geodermatophilus bullaregiensis]MBM7808668.1 AcrR family transcriptional regulator [Geodermatophilus bullaregiensis]
MGRTPGATAAGTRDRLLRAAADVFARRGYEGTRVSEVAEAAGLSNGAMYAYFGSKAELLVDALRVHGRRLLADLVAAHPTRSLPDLLLAGGRSLRRRREPDGELLVEALVAARRDGEVLVPVRGYVQERVDWLAGLVRGGQDDGGIDAALSPHAVAHLCLALAVGTALVGPDVDPVDDEEWTALLARLVESLGPARAPATTGEQMGSRP